MQGEEKTKEKAQQIKGGGTYTMKYICSIGLNLRVDWIQKINLPQSSSLGDNER